MTLLSLILQQRIISLIKQVPCQWCEPGEDVTGAGRILATLKSRTKLARWEEQIDVIAANKILGESYNGGLKTGLTVMIRRVLSNIARQLCDLRARSKVIFKVSMYRSSAMIM